LNYGQNTQLLVTRSGYDTPLIRFDLTAIPANSLIVSATLMLYNNTPGGGSCAQNGSEVRRLNLSRVLKNWDEGNQVSAQVTTTVGAQGATGDYAFLYYSGGTNVAWGARGMLAGTDYASTVTSYADVLNPGWYGWDVSALVRAWVRGDYSNYGLTLRDSTGYSASNCDYRSFSSSQNATPNQRPKLLIAYNPDVPYANAGPDQKLWTWNGGAITLDGSASRDRPGGNDATLSYSWRILQSAFGSVLTGTLPATTSSAPFTPDVAGEWLIELTVTNALGESATDQVRLQLWRIPAGHPRLYINPTTLPAVQARAVPGNSLWTQLQAHANNTYDVNDWGNVMESSALVGLVTGQASYCTKALRIAEMQRDADTSYTLSTGAGEIALVYDWCYPQMTEITRTQMINYFNTWGDKQKWSSPAHFADAQPGWGNYWPSYSFGFALAGIATYGDNARASEWLDEYRQTRVSQYDLAAINRIATGGAWPEGTVYDWLANPQRMYAQAAWQSGAGENLFQSSVWFSERLGYLLMQNYPGTDNEWGYLFHPYVSQGDAERHRGSMVNYKRIMGLLLAQMFPSDARAQQMQAYLNASPTNTSSPFMYYLEFLWNAPGITPSTPNRVSNYTPTLGQLIWRSGWPSGAADTDPCATYITFNAGDHYTYHQHYDQNAFTLWKCSDLALDSGVYSGNGLSFHDVNYYARTIAHNTLVVYNALENFTSMRSGASSNDGGQRTVAPASRSPDSVTYWDQHVLQYDTGDIARHEDAALYSYALGDATKAYNNPTYNQSANYAGNVAKVTRFQREFVYLRPLTPTVTTSNDYVVLYDRVGVASAGFSQANTKLLFHVLNAPTVSGAPQAISAGETLYANATDANVISGNGKLFFKFLSPAQHNVRVVGGRGQKAFWVFGQNYDWNWSAGEAQPRPVTDYDPIPYGEYRLELEPADAALDHNFLTVLYPTASTTLAMPATTLITVTGLAGVHLADPALNRVAMFSAALDGSAPSGTLTYTYQPTAATLNMLFDLTPNAQYNLVATRIGNVQSVTLIPTTGGTYRASTEGVLSFTVNVDGTPAQIFLPAILKNP
jgi:heparin/heparan-sulfate lyase